MPTTSVAEPERLCSATSFFDGQPPLSQGAGYAVVVGFGAFFSIFTTILVLMDYRFGGTKQTSEQVCSASDIKCATLLLPCLPCAGRA